MNVKDLNPKERQFLQYVEMLEIVDVLLVDWFRARVMAREFAKKWGMSGEQTGVGTLREKDQS